MKRLKKIFIKNNATIYKYINKNRFVRKFLILFKIALIYFLLFYKYFDVSFVNSLCNLFIHRQSKIKEFYDNKISIFTFWEPSTNVPGYIQLCVDTWKKNLPNSNIIILDYSNLHKYLNSTIISKILFKKMTLPIQADAIRVAILEKYGGIWMDIDIIIIDYRFLKDVFRYDLVFFGNPQEKDPAIGFIYASKNSRIMKEWLTNIIKKVSLYKEFYFGNYKKKGELSNLYMWNYLGNGIINKILQKAKEKEFIIFDWIKKNAIPERNIFHFEGKTGFKKAYNKLYFYPGNPQKIIYNNSGIIFLHNSWTDKKYQYMSKIQFLKQNILLSSLLKLLLKKKLNYIL